MTASMVAIERRPHDEQCERGTRPLDPTRCAYAQRFTDRSHRLRERAVWWSWLHGPARTPYEQQLARQSRTEVGA